MNLLTIVIYTAATLTVLSLILLLVIIGLRLMTDRNIRRESEFRSRAEPLLRSFLAGDVTVEVAAAVLGKSPRLAREILMEQADSLGEGGREKLAPLTGTFPFVGSELSNLRSRSWEKRLRATEALGYLGNDTALPGLMTTLRDDVLSVRFAAAQSLARLGCQDAAEPILRALDVPGEVSQRRVVEVLMILGPRVTDPMIALLSHPTINETALSIAARVVGSLKIQRGLTPLCQLLTHPSPNVRLNAVRSIASIAPHGDQSMISAIAAIAEDPSWEVRNAVMQALGRLGATGHVPLLLQGLSDQEWWVRHSAAEGLHGLGETGIAELRNAAEHHVDGYGRDMSRQILQQHAILQPRTETHP
jgi:HEAT repeats